MYCLQRSSVHLLHALSYMAAYLKPETYPLLGYSLINSLSSLFRLKYGSFHVLLNLFLGITSQKIILWPPI